MFDSTRFSSESAPFLGDHGMASERNEAVAAGWPLAHARGSV